MKFGFVNVGPQTDTKWLHDSIRKCATNEMLVDVHDEYRMTGFSRTYPNFLTAEGISGDETTPSTAQDMVLLFTRMLAGPADHTVCFYDPRVTNNWNHAYQLAKAVCFFSPWQFLYWYDRPTNSPVFSGFPSIITEDPALDFYDHLPTVWNDTKVLQSSIGQYAVIARRSGDEWFMGAMNAGTTRTLNAPLNFLTAGSAYVAHRYEFDATATNRTRVRVTHTLVDSTSILSTTLTGSSGEAVRLTPVRPPTILDISLLTNGNIGLLFSGEAGQPYSLRASSNLTMPAANWTILTNALFQQDPTSFEDPAISNSTQRFYRLSTP
jgi:alpha-glucosidase